MQPIQPPQAPKVNQKLLMMQIMHPRTASQKVISTVRISTIFLPVQESVLSKGKRYEGLPMHRSSLHQLKSKKRPISQNMRAQNLRRQRHGNNIGKQMLNRMCVLRCQRNGGSEAMMLFMDPRVQRPGVQEAMRVVEQDFSHHQTDNKIPYELGE
jgi:hypothetical protein